MQGHGGGGDGDGGAEGGHSNCRPLLAENANSHIARGIGGGDGTDEDSGDQHVVNRSVE